MLAASLRADPVDADTPSLWGGGAEPRGPPIDRTWPQTDVDALQSIGLDALLVVGV